jgi:AhpD family alkylhydroperoxidase
MLNKEQLDRLNKLDRLEPEAVEAAFKPRRNGHNRAVASGRSNGGGGRNSGVNSATLPVKYKELIAVAVALTTQCPYCIVIHSGNARRAGATEAELAEVAMVAAVLRAGASVTHPTHALYDEAPED